MNTLSEIIHQFVPMTKDEKNIIENSFSDVKLKKGDFWVSEGKICDKIGFLQKGKLRIYYNDIMGNEVTCYFVTSENFISSFSSFLTKTPTLENIVAIEECEMKIISSEDIEELSIKIPKIQIWRRIVAENLFITLEKRISMLQSKTANERYERMLKENPDIILSVPLQYTASFLGITPQHLSRLRKEIIK